MPELSPKEFEVKLGHIALRCGAIYANLFRCLPGQPITKPKLPDANYAWSELNKIPKIIEELRKRLREYMIEQPGYYKSEKSSTEHID